MKYNKEWLRPSEVKKLLALPDIEEKYEVWVLLLYDPALRVSEAINVRMRDLDLEGRCVEIYGGKGRDKTEMEKAPCKVETLKKIIRYCKHNGLRKNDYVMFSNKSKQVHRSQVYRVINKLCDKADIDKVIGTHSFRRSRAQHLLDAEYPILSVSKYLRHKRIETTLTYLNLSIADLQRDLAKINDPLDDILV
ncbi:tyrosine-type recombinase/integrase [Methanococcoides sp. FTZ1]|uniref:tyrosine-type recombinase/integrase n=1 Tax=Methanococcoides sp. FTZ1 TaxID=3439061 RepID=UPI003F85407A